MCLLVHSSVRTKEQSGAPLEKCLQSHKDHEIIRCPRIDLVYGEQKSTQSYGVCSNFIRIHVYLLVNTYGLSKYSNVSLMATVPIRATKTTLAIQIGCSGGNHSTNLR